jgi:hypothetical protein
MVRRGHILRIALPLAFVCVFALWMGGASGGALVQVNGLQLSAGGGFRPQRLPRHRFAPIEFQGHVDLRSLRGGPPPQLTEATIEFDRDGRLQTKGLATCPAEKIENLNGAEARRVCKSAEVGTGTVGILLLFNGGTVPAHAPLTLFNAPPVEGNPTVNAHVHIAPPVNETYVVPVVIERLHGGRYSYRAKFDVPALAGGGILVHVDAKVGRRYKYKGQERSYVSAHCQHTVYSTHGDFVFSDGTVIDGEIQSACVPNNF